jgi:hypothetical protein
LRFSGSGASSQDEFGAAVEPGVIKSNFATSATSATASLNFQITGIVPK